METPAFRPGRKRRVTSPDMSVLSDSVFACPGTGCSPRPPKKRCCETTAATPGTYGTWPSNSTPTGVRAGRARAYRERCRQLTAARAEYPWLAAGSQTVQQQALRDFAQAMTAFFDPGNPAGRPSWRKAGRDEGFRIVGRRGRQWEVRRVSRKVGQVWVPKAGWVRFRWSRAVPPGAKSYRVTMDRAGRWHVAFAVIPDPVPAPGNGETVGIDRGVAVAAALSTGELLRCPALTGRERIRLRRLQRRLARARRGSNRRGRVRHAIARLRPGDGPAHGLGREGVHRHCAAVRRDPRRGPEDRRHDPIRERHPENPGRNVRAKAGLNRGILGSGWGLLVLGWRTGARPGGRRSSRITRPAVLGVREGGPGLACESSRVPVHCLRFRLPRGHERGHQHRGGARRDCAGRRRDCPAREPRTSPAAPIGVVAGIPRLHAREDVNGYAPG